MLPDPTLYINQRPEVLAREMADAAELGIVGVAAPSAEFDRLAAPGEQSLIYVITETRALIVCERLVKQRHAHHSVIAEGRPVLAAGELSLAVGPGVRWVLEVNERSGHYVPDRACLTVAREVLEALGFEVPDGAVGSYTEG